MNFPRSVNSWDKLQYLIRCIDAMGEDPELPNQVNILFYTPWNPVSKKVTSRQVKGFSVRVNLFEVPEAFHVITETYGREDLKLNHTPTLMKVSTAVQVGMGTQIELEVVDNVTGIYYELGS